MPQSLAIVGGGVIGCEFASVFNRLGSVVTVIEMLDQLLPGEDKRTGRTLQQAFKKAGIAVHVKAGVEEAVPGDAGVTLRLAGGAEVTAARVLVAVGRRPVSAGLGFEQAGVQVDERGFVVTDEACRTAVPGVFAAGDVAGPPLLAHWAYHQGQIAAENAVTGSALVCDRSMVPSCVFSSPEVASCGLTEDRASAEGVEHEVAHVRLNGNSKAVCDGDADGYVRIVCEPGGGRVLGASLVGPHVTELVHELALATHAGLSLRRRGRHHPRAPDAQRGRGRGRAVRRWGAARTASERCPARPLSRGPAHPSRGLTRPSPGRSSRTRPGAPAASPRGSS